MNQSDLIIPGPIPFADVTVGEAEEAAGILGMPTRQVEGDIMANPKDVSTRFLIPMGTAFVNMRSLEGSARKIAEAQSIRSILSTLDELESAVETEDREKLTRTGKPGGNNYRESIAKMKHWLQDPAGRTPPYEVFAKGNVKLPFWAFSALPGVTCPGAGDCLKNPENGKRGWCYSFSSWTYITPYFRQLQNTILIRMEDKSWIERDAREKFRPGEAVRLYVDGDMDSIETLDYWMHFCERFPQNKFYGYSKSWGIFRQWHDRNGGRWPSNYVLNLSSGTSLERRYANEPDKFRAVVKGMMELKNPETGLPLVRGTFRAVQVKSEYPDPTKYEIKKSIEKQRPYRMPGRASQKAWTIHREEVSAAAKAAGIKGDDGKPGRVFVCPGKCFACMPGGRHACGDRTMRNVAIVIGIH